MMMYSKPTVNLQRHWGRDEETARVIRDDVVDKSMDHDEFECPLRAWFNLA